MSGSSLEMSYLLDNACTTGSYWSRMCDIHIDSYNEPYPPTEEKTFHLENAPHVDNALYYEEFETDNLMYRDDLAAPALMRSAGRFGPLSEEVKVELAVYHDNGSSDTRRVDVSYIGATASDSEVKAAISKIAPSVVFVRGMGSSRNNMWSGSGAIVDLHDIFPGKKFPKGYYGIITNHHVAPADDVKHLTVTTASGQEYKVSLMKSLKGNAAVQDKVVDAAILIIRSDAKLPTARIAKKAPEQGDTVLTAGHPLGLPKMSVTKGIISHPAQLTGDAVMAIQTDAEINPGNSGGPLFNLNGEILGLNTYVFRGTNGMSFAIPIHTQLKVLRTIFATGEFVRGNFGFDLKEFPYLFRQLENFPTNIPAAKVSWVDVGSEAYKLGLRTGDVITRLVSSDGSELIMNFSNRYEVTRFLQWMHSRRPGSQIAMVVYHRKEEGNEIKYVPETITLGVNRLTPRKALMSPTWGFFVAKDSQNRIIIAGVKNGSPIHKLGLKPGMWALVGIKAKEISSEPVLINDLDRFKQMLMMLRDSEATELTLYVADKNNPKVRKRIVLKRELPNYFVSNMMRRGLETYLLPMAA